MLRKLIGIFNKKSNKMNFTGKTLEEVEADLKNSDFQWLKGEHIGMVEKFKEIIEEGGMKFLVFQSGGRMNVDLITEFMDIFPSSPVRFDSSSPSFSPNSSPVPQPPAQKGKASVNSINYGSPVIPGVEESPIYKLLKKQKPNWVNVNISLKLNLPTKSLYNVLISSFDDADAEIANYVTEGIEIEDIRNAIAESIRSSFYEVKKTQSAKNLKTKSEDEPEFTEE